MGAIGPGVQSGFDCRLIHEHDRDVVFHGIDSVALGALEALRVSAVFERLLARRTHQNFEQVFGNHDQGIVRQKTLTTEARRHGEELLNFDC